MNNNNTTVDEQEVSKFDLLAHEWWDTKGPLRTLHEINEVRLQFIKQHQSLNACSILDIGCGGGILSEAMARVNAQVSGIDASAQAIQIAIEHAAENKLTVNYQCTPIEDFEHSPFDAITCMELLEHVTNPEIVLEHAVRLLKPGGIIFLSTISRTVKAYLSAILAAEYILSLLPKQTHDYNNFIKPSELVRLGRRLGLELIDLKGLNYNPISHRASLSDDVSVNYLLALRHSF